jgi:predicted solute-binding protein
MDPQSLFKKSRPDDSKSKTVLKKPIITSADELDNQPLIFGLKKDTEIILKTGSASQILRWIMEGSADMGFISSIDFAQLKGGWKVIPGLCISSHSAANSNLFFRKGLTKIKTIATLNPDSTHTVVLMILMKELYQGDPELIADSGDVCALLKKYDAVLLSGDQALHEAEENPAFLNINEEWYHFTGLPLVHGFWVANEMTTSKKEYEKVLNSFQLGIQNVDKICMDRGGEQKINSIKTYIKKLIGYNFGENERDSLEELFRYAFFYGLIDFIPEFNFSDI